MSMRREYRPSAGVGIRIIRLPPCGARTGPATDADGLRAGSGTAASARPVFGATSDRETFAMKVPAAFFAVAALAVVAVSPAAARNCVAGHGCVHGRHLARVQARQPQPMQPMRQQQGTSQEELMQSSTWGGGGGGGGGGSGSGGGM
jgi:uncharacterized membrane protein YgcG